MLDATTTSGFYIIETNCIYSNIIDELLIQFNSIEHDLNQIFSDDQYKHHDYLSLN